MAKVYEGGVHLTELLQSMDESINLDKQTVSQRNTFLDFISTVWNLYPHKELDGYSPYEIAAMYEVEENHKFQNKE